MMDYLKENKGLTAIVVVVVLAVGGYFAYSTGETPQLLTSTGPTATSEVSKELLSTLSNLRDITLDESIFSDAAFMSLVDFRVDIPLQPVGRSNPFAPLSPTGVRTVPRR